MIIGEPGFHCEAYKIGNEHTEFAVQKFHNKLFVIITQFGKISNLYTVRNQSVSTLMPADPLASSEDQKIFDIQQKFGAPSIELEGAIRYILNSIDVPHEILISFGVRDVDAINKRMLDDVKEALGGILRKMQPNKGSVDDV